MFTGIVEALGVVESIQRVELNQGPVVRLVVVTDLAVEAMPLGASIAVDGVCLTIVERAAGHFAADLGPETLALTTLGNARAGEPRPPRAAAQGGRSAGRPHGRRPRRRHGNGRGARARGRVAGAGHLGAAAGVALPRREGLGRCRRRQPDGQHRHRRRVLGDPDPAHARGHQAGRQAASATPSTSRPT